MKKISYIIMALIVLSSCSDFLDQKPQGKLTQDVFFSEPEGAEMGINAIYANLRAWNLVGFSWFGITEVSSDNSDTGSEPADGSYPRVDLFDKFTYNAATSELNGWWTGNYSAISTCNVALDNIDALKDESLKIKSIAQARFFRGFFYFNLVRAFGGVPLVLSVPDPAEYNIPRNSEEEVYDAIIKDLIYAAENLPTRTEWGSDNLGRVSKGTAEGLLAKVYLFRQDYTNAKKYAGQVIDRGEFNLHNDYRDLFSPDSYYSKEVMLADQYWWTTERNPTSEYVKWQGVRGGFGWGFFSPSESLHNAYGSGDPRRPATIFYSGDSIPGKGVINFKTGLSPRANNKTIWATSYWPLNNYTKMNCHLYFLRYADVILVHSEACNELGNTDEALTDLEKIRSRARNSQAPDGFTVNVPVITERGKDKLREIIWNERRLELALEGHRFFDIIRADKVVPGYATKTLKIDAGKSSFDVTQHSKFLIPQAQIDISQGVLVQNK